MSEKQIDAEKSQAKVPGALRKPIKKRKFEKRFVKYIEHPQDKQFFTDCFETREDAYVIRESLTKNDIKKLKDLYKWVKKNRKSAIKIVPLAFAGIVVAGIVIFFTVFANPLLERALEAGLEAIFEAKSDVTNLRVSLIKFRISIGSITVANCDKPMTNLFQMGRTVISLKPEAVLRGKIYIEEIRADTIRFGTERTVSGSLNKPPKVKPEKDNSGDPPLIDLKNFDAMALLNQEYDKLSSPKLYDEAISAYNETLAKWQGQVDGAKERVAELRTASQPLLNLNVNNFNVTDVQTITRTVQDITTMANTVQGAAEDAGKMVTGIEKDINMARQLEQNARNAIINDINLLKSYIDLGSGAAFAALEPFIRDMLSDTAEEYLGYGLIALEAFQKLKAEADAKPKTEKPVKELKFKGRDVDFPVRTYPKFYLGVLASDFTLDSWNWAFDLRDISSNPDLTGKPVTLALGLAEDGGSLSRKANFNGSADFRTNPPDRQRFAAVLNGSGFPISLGDKFSKAGINGLSGNSDFSANLKGHTDGGVSAGGDVKIRQPRLIDPTGTIAEAADTAIREAGLIELGVQYIHNIGQNDEFKITSNLADLIARAMRNTAEAYAKKAMDDIEMALRQKIDEYIDGKFVSKDQVDLLLRTARGDKDAMDQIRNSLNDKKKEFENRANQAGQQVKDEAAKTVQDAIKGNTPSLPVPSLPSSGGIKLPGR